MINKPKLKILTYTVLENILGKSFTRNMYLKECIKRYINSNCIYIHIPKCGGTSVSNQVFNQTVGHFSAQEVKSMMGPDFTSYFSFSVARHPMDRLFSAYTYVKTKGGERGAIKDIKVFSSDKFRSFDSFIQEWLCHNIDNNILFKPQYKYLCSTQNQFLVNYIGKIENKVEINSVLSKRLNRKIEIDHLNKTNPNIKYEISKESTKIVEKIYELDYELLLY
jgi:hypothetical protein